jgi:hypothetical protein
MHLTVGEYLNCIITQYTDLHFSAIKSNLQGNYTLRNSGCRCVKQVKSKKMFYISASRIRCRTLPVVPEDGSLEPKHVGQHIL